MPYTTQYRTSLRNEIAASFPPITMAAAAVAAGDAVTFSLHPPARELLGALLRRRYCAEAGDAQAGLENTPKKLFLHTLKNKYYSDFVDCYT